MFFRLICSDHPAIKSSWVVSVKNMSNYLKDLIMLEQAALIKVYRLSAIREAVYNGDNKDHFSPYLEAVNIEKEIEDRFIAAMESNITSEK